MCGFAAAVSVSGDLPREVTSHMIGRIAHRGPDAAGAWTSGRCQLAHCRLAVIDLVTGDQPLSTRDGRFTIAYNGEIYNYREVRAVLARDGAEFSTESDTEVVLAGYVRHGPQVLSLLNGQFAFAIWDGLTETLFLARDRFGEKPLYWAATGAALVAASDLRAVEASGIVSPRIDLDAVEAYLALGYVPPVRTIYENVHILRPGHFLRWQGGSVEVRQYWQPPLGGADVTVDEAATRVRQLLEAAVERQALAADVDVGAFLSGGLDSTTITALMLGVRGGSVRTFAAGFGDLIDELPFARAVAQRYRTEHHELQVEIDVADVLERVTTVYDEPFSDSSNIPTYLLAEFARRHVKVVLSGDGGDELFGGYEWYTPLTAGVKAGPHATLRAGALRALVRAGAPVERSRDRAILTARGRTLSRRYSDPLDRHLGFIAQPRHWRRSLWGARHVPDAAQTLLVDLNPQASGLDRPVEFDLRSYLPGDILVKVDRATMAHGLEARAPFLDCDLAEFVLSLPPGLRIGDAPAKGLLRRAASDLWPLEVRSRSKQGFGAPIGQWLTRPDVEALWRRAVAPTGPLAWLLPGLGATEHVLPQQRWTLLCLGLWLLPRESCLAHLA